MTQAAFYEPLQRQKRHWIGAMVAGVQPCLVSLMILLITKLYRKVIGGRLVKRGYEMTRHTDTNDTNGIEGI